MNPAEMDSLDQLADLLAESDALPVLFVGSGLSRRYIDSPDWDGLISFAASLTDYPVDYYSGQLPAETPRDERLPKVAGLIATRFHEEWWTSAKYRQQREEEARSLPGRGDPLKAKIADHLAALAYTKDTELSVEREKLGRAKVHAIITTNFDKVLEDSFSDFKVFTGQQDVLFASPQYVGEIYKIHGSLEEPTSMILTGEDYDLYRRKNPYLIAKIMTLFVEHPVIFFGYSLRDPHILELLGTLVSCLSEPQLATFNKRLIFVGRVSERRSKGLSESSITVPGHTFGVHEFGVDDFGGVFDVLSELPEQYPVKLLRNLQERVTQMAYSSASSERVHVLPLKEGERVEDVQVVVGVGAFERLGEKGYAAYSRSELFLDMIAGADDHNVQNMIDNLVPHCFRSAKFSPIFYPRYLAEQHGVEFPLDALPARAHALLVGDTKVEPYPGRRPDNWQDLTFRQIQKSHPELAENLASGCRYEEDDVVALGRYLWGKFVGNAAPSTTLAKAGAKFDRLVYGEDFRGDRDVLRSRVREELAKTRH